MCFLGGSLVTKKSYEFEGKNIEEAINKGLSELNVTRDEVEIKILDEGTAGLFGLMGAKPAKVQIKLLQKLHQRDIFAYLTDFIKTLLKLISFDKAEVSVAEEAENIVKINIDTKSDAGRIIIGSRGKTLQALQTLLNTVLIREMRKVGNNEPKSVLLDIDTYKKRHEEKLKAIVKKAIETVRQTHKPYKLNPMPPFERRIVHLLVNSNPDVTTVSTGIGSQRHIIIKLR